MRVRINLSPPHAIMRGVLLPISHVHPDRSRNLLVSLLGVILMLLERVIEMRTQPKSYALHVLQMLIDCQLIDSLSSYATTGVVP